MEYLTYINKETGKELLRHDLKNMFAGELIATIELLAYENKLNVNLIKTKVI